MNTKWQCLHTKPIISFEENMNTKWVLKGMQRSSTHTSELSWDNWHCSQHRAYDAWCSQTENNDSSSTHRRKGFGKWLWSEPACGFLCSKVFFWLNCAHLIRKLYSTQSINYRIKLCKFFSTVSSLSADRNWSIHVCVAWKRPIEAVHICAHCGDKGAQSSTHIRTDQWQKVNTQISIKLVFRWNYHWQKPLCCLVLLLLLELTLPLKTVT